MTLEPGARLGRYEVLGLIGAGGMGEVYKARDTGLGRDVAIKVLPEAVTSDPERRRRFEREARAAGALDHPNVIVVHDVGQAEGRPYLVTELLEGETLRDRLPLGPLRRREAAEAAVQVALGLAAVHAKGIAHRDLKPENLFFTRDGRVKILDFGVARWHEPGRSRATATETEPGARIGTAVYMSPEQVRGRHGDARSDIFALGIVLHETLTGAHPFKRATGAETQTAILREEPTPLTGLGLPEALERIVLRCLEKRPEDRFQSAHDLALALQSVAGPQPVTPAPRRSGRRAWRLAAAAVVLVAASAAGVQWCRGRTARPALDPKRVVVAVFENLTGDASLDAVGRTAADHISDGLTLVQDVKVVPRSAVLLDRAGPGTSDGRNGAPDPVVRLAVETGAGLVVSGTYSLEGGDLHIQARLTEATSGRLQGLPPAIGSRSAPATAIEAVRQRVMGAVAVQLDPIWLASPDETPPTYDAYREYLVSMETGVDAVAHLHRALELDPDFVSARLHLISWSFAFFDYPEADRIQSDGAQIHMTGTLRVRHADQSMNSCPAKQIQTEAFIGACLLVHRQTLIAMAGFDPDYFFYFEDLELSYRLSSLGHKIVCAAQALAYHDRGKGTPGLSYRGSGSYPRQRAYYVIRNRWLTIALHFQPRTLMILSPMLALYELALFIGALSRGWIVEWFKASFWMLKNAALVCARRTRCQRLRKVPDRAILSAGPLPFAPGVVQSRITQLSVGALERVLNRYWLVARRWL